MERVTIKSQMRSGTPAYPASKKQIKNAKDILTCINGDLDEIASWGYPEYADAIGADLDKQTNLFRAGARDIIDYLVGHEIDNYIFECLRMSRQKYREALDNNGDIEKRREEMNFFTQKRSELELIWRNIPAAKYKPRG